MTKRYASSVDTSNSQPKRSRLADSSNSLRSYKTWGELTKTFSDHPPTSKAYREIDLGPDRSYGAQRHVTDGDTSRPWFVSLHDFRNEKANGFSMPSEADKEELRQFNQRSSTDVVPRLEGRAPPMPNMFMMKRGDHQSLVFGWSDPTQGDGEWNAFIHDISLEEGTVPTKQSERIETVRKALSEMVTPSSGAAQWERKKLKDEISSEISNTVKSQLDTIATMLVQGVEEDKPMTGMIAATEQATSAAGA